MRNVEVGTSVFYTSFKLQGASNCFPRTFWWDSSGSICYLRQFKDLDIIHRKRDCVMHSCVGVDVATTLRTHFTLKTTFRSCVKCDSRSPIGILSQRRGLRLMLKLKVPGGPAARQTPLKYCIVDPFLPHILEAGWIHPDSLGVTRRCVDFGRTDVGRPLFRCAVRHESMREHPAEHRPVARCCTKGTGSKEELGCDNGEKCRTGLSTRTSRVWLGPCNH
jgi:hypothetical protein